jgi:hypothetical protein
MAGDRGQERREKREERREERGEMKREERREEREDRVKKRFPSLIALEADKFWKIPRFQGSAWKWHIRGAASFQVYLRQSL